MKLVYIGGAGRSGSTLLERMLARLPGVTPLGEVTHLWERGLVENQLCGCGEPFRRCEHWRSITTAASLSGEAVQPQDLVRIRRRARASARLQLLAPFLAPIGRSHEMRYGQLLERIYRGAAGATGSEVLVDSSKYPVDALLLRNVLPEDIQLHLLHLVRDSPAVVHAWRKRKRRPEIHWRQEYMPRYPWWTTTVAWLSFNMMLEQLGRRPGVRYLLVRYEDLVTEPNETLQHLASFLGVTAPEVLVQDGCIRLETSHTVSGNPSRFQSGLVPLKPDNAWKDELGSPLRKIVELVTWPLRNRYGYASEQR